MIYTDIITADGVIAGGQTITIDRIERALRRKLAGVFGDGRGGDGWGK